MSATYNRIKHCLKQADISEAERLLEVLVDSNNASLEELQVEIAEGINILQTVSSLTYLLKQQKQDTMEAIAQINKGKALSPRKILDSAKN